MKSWRYSYAQSKSDCDEGHAIAATGPGQGILTGQDHLNFGQSPKKSLKGSTNPSRDDQMHLFSLENHDGSRLINTL